jgi:hypothetical protein
MIGAIDFMDPGVQILIGLIGVIVGPLYYRWFVLRVFFPAVARADPEGTVPRGIRYSFTWIAVAMMVLGVLLIWCGAGPLPPGLTVNAPDLRHAVCDMLAS